VKNLELLFYVAIDKNVQALRGSGSSIRNADSYYLVWMLFVCPDDIHTFLLSILEIYWRFCLGTPTDFGKLSSCVLTC